MAGLTLTMPPRFVDLVDSNGCHILINVMQIATIFENGDYTCVRTADGHNYYFSESLSDIYKQVFTIINICGNSKY